MFRIPGANSLPPDVQVIVDESVRRFEQVLRTELGVMAMAVNMPRYVELYRAEATELVQRLQEKA